MPPSNTANKKKMAILGCFNNTNASKPNELTIDFSLPSFFATSIKGKVNE